MGPALGLVGGLARQPDLGSTGCLLLGLGRGHQRGGQRLQPGIGDQPDRIRNVLLLTVGVEGGDCKATIGPQFELDARPAGTQGAHHARKDGDGAVAGVGIAGAQHGGDELAGVAVEDQQRVIHVLAEVAVVGRAFLLAVGGIIGAVTVQQDVLRHAITCPLAEVDLKERPGQPVAGPRIDSVLQAREGGLTGEVRGTVRQAATHQLEQGVRAQRIGIVLVFVPTGDLKDALADEGVQRVLHGAAAPLRDEAGERGAQLQGGLGFGEPRQSAIGGQASAVEGRLQRTCGRSGEGDGRCGRIGGHGSLLGR
jgi:hypothetical protein